MSLSHHTKSEAYVSTKVGATLLITFILVASCAQRQPIDQPFSTQQFDPQDPEVAYMMAALSNLAYLIDEDRSELEEVLKVYGFSKPRYFSHWRTGTAGYVTHGLDTVIIVFRGTTGIRDGWVDAQLLLVNGFGGKVHLGFKRAFEALRDKIEEVLSVALEEVSSETDISPKLIIAGHSLGAGLAQLMALNEIQRGREIFGVYPFGSPRVGNGCFAKAYDAVAGDKTYHHEVEGDNVMKFPAVRLGYSHAGGYWRLLNVKGGELTEERRDPETPCGKDQENVEMTVKEKEIFEEALAAINRSLEEGIEPESPFTGNHDIKLYRNLLAVSELEAKLRSSIGD